MNIRKKAVLFVLFLFLAINCTLVVVENTLFLSFRDQVLYSQADEMYQAVIDNSTYIGGGTDQYFKLLETAPPPGTTNLAGSVPRTFLEYLGHDQPDSFCTLTLDGTPVTPEQSPPWFRELDGTDLRNQIAQAIVDRKVRFVYSPPKDPRADNVWPDLAVVRILLSQELIFVQRIPMGDTRVRIEFLHRTYESTINNLILLTLLINLAGFLIMSGLSIYFMDAHILSPIRTIQNIFSAFSLSSPEGRWTGTRKDEFGLLGQSFNHMADDIQSYQNHLEEMVINRNSELEEVRRQTAFGSMMAAGIAHDLKSPLSSVNTALSWLVSSQKDLRKAFEQHTMTQGDLTAFLETMEEGTKIMDSALQKAINLSRSFKDVVADQLGGEIRPIDLASYLEDVFMSMRPRLKKNRIVATLDCPKNLELICDPGALSQVLINLLENSIVHAFNNPRFEASAQSQGNPRRIRVQVDDKNELVRFTYRDNGTGLSAEARDKLFESMYTTRRTEGGTGYGMVMIRELVVNRMHGSIIHDPAPDPAWNPDSATFPGVCFVLEIPRNVSPPDSGLKQLFRSLS